MSSILFLRSSLRFQPFIQHLSKVEQDLKERIQQIVNRALRERSRLSQGGDMEYAHLAGYMTSALEQISMILKEGA